jgi:hypothetical protein
LAEFLYSSSPLPLGSLLLPPVSVSCTVFLASPLSRAGPPCLFYTSVSYCFLLISHALCSLILQGGLPFLLPNIPRARPTTLRHSPITSLTLPTPPLTSLVFSTPSVRSALPFSPRLSALDYGPSLPTHISCSLRNPWVFGHLVSLLFIRYSYQHSHF